MLIFNISKSKPSDDIKGGTFHLQPAGTTPGQPLDHEKSDLQPVNPSQPTLKYLIELRLQIYKLLLCGKPDYFVFSSWPSGLDFENPEFHPAILTVDRTLWAKASPIVYGKHTLRSMDSASKRDDTIIYDSRRPSWIGDPYNPSLSPQCYHHPVKQILSTTFGSFSLDEARCILSLAPALKPFDLLM